MNLPFELHVALRYLLAKRKQAFISVISLVSTIGVAVGVIGGRDSDRSRKGSHFAHLFQTGV